MKLENLHIIIADDHPLFRNALRQALTTKATNVTWHETDCADSLQALLDEHEALYDLILLDLEMPGAYGYSALVHLRKHYPEIPVIIISAHEDNSTISRAVHHGCAGFIPKSSSMEVFTNAISAVMLGDIWLPSNVELLEFSESDNTNIVLNKLSDLTPKQYKVLQMFAEGLLNKQIAYELGISEATIKAHATAIFRKLGVNNRTQAVIVLQQLNNEQKTEIV